VDTIDKNVVLGGTAPNIADATYAVEIANKFSSGVVNTIKITGEDQVMLKVRVVEVRRDVLKQFGINLQALLQVGNFAFNLASITQVGGVIPAITPGAGYKGVWTNGTDSITGVIRAMESDGVMKTLAEPNLTAISGQSAKFHAGGEVPFQTCTGPITAQVCNTTFKDYGVSLDFSPLVLSEGRINLKVKSEVSELGPEINNGVSFNTRSAETNVELPSGGSMMLAGLIKDDMRQQIDGTPGLKSIPVLGTLFRSRDYTNNQSELVVIVTPYLWARSLSGN
jgi:pilus assembly protein CpaC